MNLISFWNDGTRLQHMQHIHKYDIQIAEQHAIQFIEYIELTFKDTVVMLFEIRIL